jgi:hypothetical protein
VHPRRRRPSRRHYRRSAYLLRDEADRGSIEAGKLADLVVLSDEPSDDAVDAIPGIEVVVTVPGGQVVEVASF